MNNTDTSILVTGASSGIGLAVSRLLLEKGFQVIGVSRGVNQEVSTHDRFTSIQCDLTDFDALSLHMKTWLKTKPNLGGVVFSAGKGYFGGLEQLDQSNIKAVMDLNLLSPILLSKLVVPYLKRQGRGKLIFIGSEAALKGTKNGTVYCASKFGLRGFVQALSAECANAGVNLTLINPGMVDTPFFNKLAFKPGDDISNAISPTTLAKCVINTLNTSSETLIDEINLSPRNKVIQFK